MEQMLGTRLAVLAERARVVSVHAGWDRCACLVCRALKSGEPKGWAGGEVAKVDKSSPAVTVTDMARGASGTP